MKIIRFINYRRYRRCYVWWRVSIGMHET